MSPNSNLTVHAAQSCVREGSGICHTQQPTHGGASYNADPFEELIEEHFERRENGRIAKAKHGKMSRRLSRECRGNGN